MIRVSFAEKWDGRFFEPQEYKDTEVHEVA